MAKRRQRPTGPEPVSRSLDELGRIQSPTIRAPGIAQPMPTPGQMSKMELDQLKQVMRAYRIDLPWADYIDDNRQYLRRMSTLSARSNAFNDELDRMLDLSTTKGARMIAKHTQRSYAWQRAAGTNVDKQRFIWITDEEENEFGQIVLCDVCDSASGFEGTLEEIAGSEWGMPGQACLGGNECRCELMVIGYD